jgi:hypothetical protein
MAGQRDGTEPTPFGFEPRSVLVHTHKYGHRDRKKAHADLDHMLTIFEPQMVREQVRDAIGFLVGRCLPRPNR